MIASDCMASNARPQRKSPRPMNTGPAKFVMAFGRGCGVPLQADMGHLVSQREEFYDVLAATELGVDRVGKRLHWPAVAVVSGGAADLCDRGGCGADPRVEGQIHRW